MPFTLAHPAIILPLQKKGIKLSLTALVSGSIVPDLEFLFQMREVENISHQWYGIAVIDLPVGLLACFLFHNLLRRNFLANLPGYFQRRFLPAVDFNWNGYWAANKLTVLISLLIGILSHLFLDGFTHHDGSFVQHIAVLAVPLNMAGLVMPVYFLLQLLLSMAGVIIISAAIHHLPQEDNHAAIMSPNKYYWPLMILVYAVVLTIRFFAWPQYNNLSDLIVAALGGVWYAWITGSVFIKFYTQKNILK